MRISRTDLAAIVTPSNAEYSGRFTREEFDRLMGCADPVADEAVLSLREGGYEPHGGQLDKLRALADAGDDAAQGFFAAMAERPGWVDSDLLERGRRLAFGLSGLYGISLLHSLYSGGVFVRSAIVTGATGRLGSDPSTRILETAGFIGQIMAPGGLDRGAPGFEAVQRVRLLHGSIRYWTKKSESFAVPYVGEPIDQTMLAMTNGLFGYLNVRSLLRLGVPLSDADIEAHHHLWRYVGWLIGIDDTLLTADIAEERRLWSALVAHQAFSELFSVETLDAATEIMAGLGAPGVPSGPARALIRALMLHLSGGEFLGVPTESAKLLPTLALCGLGTSFGSAYYLVPGARPCLQARGRRLLAEGVKTSRRSGFGVEIEQRNELEQEFLRLAGLAVAERFRGRM